jgi:hypothetical protein
MDEAITRLTKQAHSGFAGLPGPVKALVGFGMFNDNGAMDELAKLLPPMVEKMEELLRQQAQVFQEFNNQLTSLRLQSDTLGQINSQWQSINQEVAKYLDAGGDAAKANDMIQLGLQQIVRQAGAELTQGYDQAVQDAIRLNDLALQRLDLQKQFKQQEFGLINADSIERTQAGAVSRAQQLKDLRQQYTKSLDDLDSQISLESKKVTAERQIFDIATSISDLHRQDEALQLASLQMQLQKYKDLQNAVSSITSGAATPGPGDAGLVSQLKDLDAKISDYSARLKLDQSKEDGQNQSANDAAYLLQLVNAQKSVTQQVTDSAGGSLAGTGIEGEHLNAIEAAQAALNAQAKYAAEHPKASPWYRDLGGYTGSLMQAGSDLAQQQQGIMGSAPTVGTNPGSYKPSQLSLSGLQGVVNSGYNMNQQNAITINVTVPPGTSMTQIGPMVADSIMEELDLRSRQGITG